MPRQAMGWEAGTSGAIFPSWGQAAAVEAIPCLKEMLPADLSEDVRMTTAKAMARALFVDRRPETCAAWDRLTAIFETEPKQSKAPAVSEAPPAAAPLPPAKGWDLRDLLHKAGG